MWVHVKPTRKSIITKMLDEDGLHVINIIGATFGFGAPILAQPLVSLAKISKKFAAGHDFG